MEKRLILPSDQIFSYCGRIDFDKKDAPVFIYACSNVRFTTDSAYVGLVIENIHACYENAIGVLVDGEYKDKFILPDQGETLVDISPALVKDGQLHEITVFKRMDAAHYYVLKGVEVEETATVAAPVPLPERRIEVYGDSVSCGEVSEAIEYCGLPDPENHNGIYSNSFYSYSWMTARKLNAQLHDVAQGGISLFDNEGYFAYPNYVGMLSTYDKLQYHPDLGPKKQWDFSQYIPHVVVIAIGQNDAHPVNYMAEEYDGEHAKLWRQEYRGFIEKLMEKYPQAHFVLTTTILGHDPAWDRAIEEVTASMNNPKVTHFLYTKNGCGTQGHIRKPEADVMSDELAAYINTLQVNW